MAAFYTAGTIALVAGSAVVTGTGTAFTANLMKGWVLQLLSAGGDLTDHEIASVDSATQLTLARTYQGTTGGGRAYQVKPTRATDLLLAQAIQALTASYQGVYDTAGQGMFAPGSLATPGVRASTDTDTGAAWLAANVLALITGGVERLRVTSAGAQLTGLLSGTAVTQSNVDATTGRLVKAGDYGWGGNGAAIGDASVTDNSIVQGAYTYNTALGSLGAPAGITHGQLIHRRRTSSGGETQMLVVEVGSTAYPTGTLLTRARSTGAWTAWMTAGVADAGANANGSYLKLPDGTLICATTLTLLSTGELTWTYPAAFASTAISFGGLVRSGSLSSLAARVASRTVTAADISAFSSANARLATTFDVSAIGRWI